jgi:hypothetical protein
VLYINVAKVDLDVAYTYMRQAYVSSVSYICWKFFIWMLHMFAMFSSIFLDVFCKCFRRLFQGFIDLLLYVATVAFGCFKSRSSVAHEMHV